MSKIYSELASGWYQLFTPLEHYEDEANLYHNLLENEDTNLRTMLELGSGAGHNAFYLKQWYTLILSDVSEDMLTISKKINPGCRHVAGDMRTMRLQKTFDVVFIHDAVMYMLNENDLHLAIETAFVHCKKSGWVLISPDYVKENFAPSTDTGGEDKDGRALRYIEWKQDADPSDDIFTVDYAFLMQERDGTIHADYDHHVEGLFTTETWLNLLRKYSNHPKPIPDHYGRVNFLAQKR